ncbi:hypothetical protein, partial [Streptomyces prasinus]
FLDTRTAQQALIGESGVFTNVIATAADGVSDAQLKKDVTAALGADSQVLAAELTQAAGQLEVGGVSRGMRSARGRVA